MKLVKRVSFVYIKVFEVMAMVKRMSETLIQISSIKNLNMVNFYRLSDDGKSLPGIIAYYGNGKTINLCSADEGFSELLDKVVEVYSHEKEFGRIVTDNYTGRVLERSISTSGEDYERLLERFTETSNPLFLDKAFAHVMVIPAVKFIIESIYNINDMPVNWDLYNKTWYGRGILTGSVKEKSVKFPYLITRYNDKIHHVIINGVLHSGNALNFDIVHDFKGIKIIFSDSLEGWSGSYSAEITETSPRYSFKITCRGETVYNDEGLLSKNEQLTETSALQLSFAGAEFTEYGLPWGERFYLAVSDNKVQYIFSSSNTTETVSYSICSEKLNDSGGIPILLGLFSYMYTESVSASELHLLDMGYPQLALYKEKYAGKKYTLKRGTQNGN